MLFSLFGSLVVIVGRVIWLTDQQQRARKQREAADWWVREAHGRWRP